jgi:tRNA threonylcarbamoyladenosine modification (KEOPS) complex  Pcc1 subunit
VRAKIKLCIGAKYASSLYKALQAEVSQPAPEKGRISISLDNSCIVMEVDSPTISGLRAITNSFLLLAYASYSTLNTAEDRRLS